jgi:hypothetical protein
MSWLAHNVAAELGAKGREEADRHCFVIAERWRQLHEQRAERGAEGTDLAEEL